MASFDIIVETPKGSAQKYNYNPSTRFFELKKILPTGMMFPYDFGFIPATQGEDGDPLDVIVLSEFSSFPGCMMKCRIIGGFKAEQSKEAGKRKLIRNDRFIAVPECSLFFSNVTSLKDLPAEIVSELESFFVNYNKIEGKTFKILGKLDNGESEKLIRALTK
jgi:inorganic pyrophosphatase